MPELPRISAQEVLKVLNSLGFEKIRQKGSHVILKRNGKGCVIPMHKEVAIGTLKSALKQAEISPEEFIEKHKNS